MKNIKVWRIVWMVAILATLSIILYLVVLYKVVWEHKDLNTYLYFYDCNGEVCSTTNKMDDYYNRVVCEDDVCPHIENIAGNSLILKNDSKSWIYNYIDGEIVNDNYIEYRYIGNDNYIVTTADNKQGIINIDGSIVFNPDYDKIMDYMDGFISYMLNGKYGIASTDGQHNIEAKFEDIVLLNTNSFAGRIDNVYQIYSYSDSANKGTGNYDYVYQVNDVILVVNNNKIDILDANLKSTLLLKIDTFYSYTTEKERDSLNIYSDGENVYFRVFIDEYNYNSYVYGITNKKLI